MTYDSGNLRSLCDFLANKDSDLAKIINDNGYPVAFSRPPGFPALIRLILEQQVSLLSAKAAYLKLQQKVREITPGNLLGLTDEELRQCYFSRQKSKYARILSQAVTDKQIRIDEWPALPDDEVKKVLVQIKGIGPWTADNYLLLCLRRTDIFPIGDIALLNSMKKVKRLSVNSTNEIILALAESWRPYRSVAAIILWHAYIVNKRINIADLEY